jgi:hypothetical protein
MRTTFNKKVEILNSNGKAQYEEKEEKNSSHFYFDNWLKLFSFVVMEI